MIICQSINKDSTDVSFAFFKSATTNSDTLTLTVADVMFGGNSGNKSQYFYTYSRNYMMKGDTNNNEFYVQLMSGDNNNDRFKITNFASSSPVLTADTKSIPNCLLTITLENPSKDVIYPSLINFVVIVHDTIKDEYFCCDPQVINSPPVPTP